MHKNRTVEGLRKQHEKQRRYENMLLGKDVDSNYIINGLPFKGRIEVVEYIGNSTYGIVKISLDNGCDFLISSVNGFVPTKEDFRNNGIAI